LYSLDNHTQTSTFTQLANSCFPVLFRTSSPTGLLFLAAGTRDFLLVELISGCLQVRLDLGSGERSLHSEKHLHLNDLAWHSMQLTHDRHNITLTVDRNSHINLHLPGPDLELSVNDGLFVGNKAWLTHPYLLTSTLGFRGCMDEAVFNEHNLLSSLRPYSGYKSVYEVSLGCSPQFSATEEDPVSLYSSKSFIALPTWEVPQEGVFKCELYPSAGETDGVVLYSLGNHRVFVAIEIQNGHLMATVGKGKIKMKLRSLLRLKSTSTWYPIELRLLPQKMQLKVGEELLTTNLTTELQSIQLKGNLYIGGLSEQARLEARRSGQLSIQPEGQLGSFKGCLREINVNGQKTGLPYATVTKDVTIQCDKRYATSSPTESTKMDVTTAQPVVNTRKHQQFLVLKKLELAEGARATLEPKHIKVILHFVNLNYRKLQIHPSQLMFHVEAQPIHGHLRLDLLPNLTFSMVDLWQGRIIYVHSGSEEPSDFFMFSVFSSGKKELPLFLKGNRLHRFDISISPVNDAPVLTNNRSAKNIRTEAGYLEHQDYPDRLVYHIESVDTCSQIYFVHSGVPNSRLPLRVSDGEKVSNTVTLRIMAVPLEYKLVNNSGLEAGQGKAAIISTNQLAVQVKAADQGLDIRYDVTELPQYGNIQRLHSSGEWKSTTSFSQKLLQKERIRYLNTYYGIQSQNNATDQFKCKVNIGSHVTEEIVVPVLVHWINFKVTRSKMELNGIQEAIITPEDLHAISKGVKLNDSELHFRLLTVVKKGQVYFNNTILQINSTFSQKNITDGLIKYKLLNKVQEDTRDTFSFQLFTPQAYSAIYDFRINIRAESNTVTVQNKGLSILEGASKVITQDVLFTHTASNREVQYKVITSPRNGYLRRINLSNSTSINDNIKTFTNQDVMQERIMYVHDDSETQQDFFTFQIVVFKPQKHGVKKEDRDPEEHRFNISVQLVNDQKPVRVVDKVFHVARDGQKLVTVNDLRFRDEDSDFDDSWLVYTRRGIPMGELVRASDTNHKVYEFTQRDLEQNKVLFIHRGVSSGRFVLFVTDGKHYVSTLLEVMAQDPYLQVENNTGIMVQRSGVTILTSANLSVVSNLDIRDPEEVTYEVFLPPDHGLLHFIDKDFEPVTEADAVSTFTQQDLVNGRLAYHHDGSQELFDMFNVTARAKEGSAGHGSNTGRREVNLDIGIPVVHENSPASEIVFTVKSPPSFDVVLITIINICFVFFVLQGNTGLALSSFTQEDINQGFIVYHQNGSERTNDSILLEVTNGMTTVGPIRLEVDIIPLLLPLQVSSSQDRLTVFERNLLFNSHHFTGMNFLYEMERELISYIHDGSETLTDDFNLMANQTEVRKHSLPCTVHIDITPVNDESPTVTVNKGLKMWVGSVTEISVNDLSAEDLDTPSVGLEFVVTPPSNGHLALKSAPSRHILNFTQYHIETGHLVFVHSGAMTGGFHFQVNDGVHFAPRQIFSTTAHSLDLTLQKNHPLKVYPGITMGEINILYNLNAGQVLYQQTKPEMVGWSATDTFLFTVSLPPAFLPPQTFSIIVSYQGNENHDQSYKTEVKIDRSKLDATNLIMKLPDTQQKGHHVMYSLISLPKHGVLSIQGQNLTRYYFYLDTQMVKTGIFINIYMNHSLQGEPLTGVFYFNVTDGHHGPLYKLFSLEVVKPSVFMVNNTGLSLVQGKTAVVLTTNQLSAQTNSRHPSNITYTVISNPHHGRIAINDQEVSTFCHEDLQFGRVVYHMTDLSESEDSFEISVSAHSPGVEYGNITAQMVTVNVLPLIYLREPVRVPSGIAVKLGKAMIDASELARISRVDPLFEVLSPPKHGKLVKSFTFRDVVQGRVAIEETLSDSDSIHSNKSLLPTNQGHAPALPLNDSFTFLVRAGNVQPAKGELHFTILPHHQMHYGPGGGGQKGEKASRNYTTTRFPSHNRTTSGEKGHRKVGLTTPNETGDNSHPHILSNKNHHHNKTHHKGRNHHRWGNHTRSGIHGGKSTTQNPAQLTPNLDKTKLENHEDVHPVYYEILPRPASDPLLIILPLLACLLLIVILVVLILVFRHRKEKQAQIRLLQELAALPPMSEESGSPSSGCGERSIAMPSVVVTPLGPSSCPTSPRTPISPRRRSLAPGMTFWGPFDDDGNIVQREFHEKNNLVRCNVYSSEAFQSPLRSRCPTPSLKDSQYWV
uniref:Laminin G domain-containing protein n=1 Tax=Periophthalmus magnuspinnatus TaxID=409849 RepID=A0A3B4AWC9_9GOBI